MYICIKDDGTSMQWQIQLGSIELAPTQLVCLATNGRPRLVDHAYHYLKGLAMPMKSIVTENIFKFTMCTASKRLYSTCNLWRHCTDMYNILKWIEDI